MDGRWQNSKCLKHGYREDSAEIQTLIFRVMEPGIESSGFTTEALRQFQGGFLRLYRRARNRGFNAAAEIYHARAESLLELLREDGTNHDDY